MYIYLYTVLLIIKFGATTNLAKNIFSYYLILYFCIKIITVANTDLFNLRNAENDDYISWNSW